MVVGKEFVWLVLISKEGQGVIYKGNFIDYKAVLKYLLALLERKTQGVFSGIVCSFVHLPAVYKLMYLTHTIHLYLAGWVGFCRYTNFAILCYELGLK